MKKLVPVCIVLSMVCCSYADLADLNPAAFRTDPSGTGTTTYQGWSFGTNANPAIADVVNNAFGDPTLDVHVNSYTGGWLQSYGGRSGVWSVTAMDAVDIYLPNTGNNEPGSWKEIWLQVIYADPGGTGAQLPLVVNPAYATLDRQPLQYLGDGFVLDTYSIIIEPNPPSEELLTWAIQCQVYIDEIVVDTICVPEPATISLMGFGALAFLRKRRAR